MRKVFIEELPRSQVKNGVDWEKSVGKMIPFIYDNIKGEFKIKSYNYEKKTVEIYYDNKDIVIYTSNLLKCKIGRIVGKFGIHYKEGDIIMDKKRNITVIGTTYVNPKTNIRGSDLVINYRCNVCGYEGSSLEYCIKGQKTGCLSCSNQKTILGFNTIWDTDRWMCDLGISEEDAKTNTSGSANRIMVTCPICKTVKKVRIADVLRWKTIGCLVCGDKISSYEKGMISILNQLGVSFNREVEFEWGEYWNEYKNKKTKSRYDFVIEEEKLIIEVDGEFHRKNNKMSNQTVEQSKYIDNKKDELAIKNGYNVTRIKCQGGNVECLKDWIIDNVNKYDFLNDNIDWMKVEHESLKNIHYEICDYWNNKEDWETTRDVGNVFKVRYETVNYVLNKMAKLKLCNYNGKKEAVKSSRKFNDKNRTAVRVYKNEKFLGEFASHAELERVSDNLFGEKLLARLVARSIKNNKAYKGYTFEKKVKEEEVNIAI